MFVGFDYGTSNCAMSYMNNGQPTLIPIHGNNFLMPSTLYALDRGFIAAAVLENLVENEKLLFAQERSALLQQARSAKIEFDIHTAADGLFFGNKAIEHYIAAPQDGYFIKSPKSFLGASGLRKQLIDFFEDIVTAMMQHIKNQAEIYLDQSISQAVIGRPVNFQGIDAKKSNQQAQSILLSAAKRAGFTGVEFLYEPLAAGFDFETRLQQNKRVLVIDIGGGTTDCSMVLMGPSHINNVYREEDVLGHTGERIGGNDFDIEFAQKLLMPEFGMLSPLKTGLPMPVMPFVNAVSINDVGAQASFYESQTTQLLEKLKRETTELHLFNRFVRMREEKQNFAVVRAAEHGKIILSEQSDCRINLDFIEKDFRPYCIAGAYAEISAPLLKKISLLINDVITQAGDSPEIVYLTGGSAKSPLIRQMMYTLLGRDVAVVDGDHFGSVTAGLGVWAERIFK